MKKKKNACKMRCKPQNKCLDYLYFRLHNLKNYWFPFYLGEIQGTCDLQLYKNNIIQDIRGRFKKAD